MTTINRGAHPASEALADPEARRAIATVLVVDDEAEVVSIIAETLEAGDFQVFKAAGFWEALDCLQDRRFDLMVTAVTLPGTPSGIELVAYARLRNPTLKSLFMSRNSEPVTDNPCQDDFIAKPFRPRELLGCAFELLYREIPPHRRGRQTQSRAAIEAKLHVGWKEPAKNPAFRKRLFA